MSEASEAGPTADAARWRFGRHVLDEATLELSLDGNKVELRRKPLELLMFFVRNPREVVTKDELFEAVWPGRIVSENSLTNAIGLLRTALGDQAQELIKSVYGYGYRFTPSVVREDALREPLPAATFDFQPGEPVPHRSEWTFERSLGGGGHGEVWLAQHRGTHDRRVFKFARGGSSLGSLKREITLSRLMRDSLGDRPDQVTLLDWNLEREPYFIGQQWCAGGSLPQWAEAQGCLDKLDLPVRLELVAQVADALAAAHSVGVLHKDLKPSNLLVQPGSGGSPQMKLADFGSARLVGGERLASMNITQLGLTHTLADGASGTPLYMAPEVLAGHPPTIQSDLYSLGVILYQVAVGNLRRPLAPGWEQGIADELLREDIAAAAAGDPQARLADAAELAQRLRRLDERRRERSQEQAEQQRAAQALKQLERANARRGLLQALAATLLIAFATTSYLLWHSGKSRRLAEAEAARANAVTSFLTDDLLSAANPLVSGRRDVLMRSVIDSAAARLDRFKDQPRLLGTLQRVLGTAYAGMIEREPAERLLGAAEATLTAELGAAAAETEAARTALRQMYIDTSDFPRWIAISHRIARIQAAAGTPDIDTTLLSLTVLDGLACWQRFLYMDVARCDQTLDDRYQEAAGRLGVQSGTVLTIQWFAGAMRFRNGRYADAIPLLQASWDGLSRQRGESNLQVLEIRSMLDHCLIRTGRVEEGLAAERKVLAEFVAVNGPSWHYALVSRRNIAEARLLLGDPAGALADLQQVKRDRLESQGDNIALPELSLVIAEAYEALHQPAQALAELQQRLSALTPPASAQQRYYGIVLNDRIAGLRSQLGDIAAAERQLRQNLDTARAAMTNGEWLLGWCAYRLGDFLRGQGRAEEAGPLLAEAVPVLEAALGPQDPRSKQARAVQLSPG